MISYLPMAMKCSNCGKGVLYGHNVSHSKRRTPRVFKPNLHSARVKIGTNFVKLKLCTKCVRLVKKISVLNEAESAAKAVSSQTSPATA
jgi:large subunit ribosomal protein L28